MTALAILAVSVSVADTIVLKNGTVYRGTLDKDNTLAYVSDNLKRVIFYNSKIARVDSDKGFSNLERFELIQPLDVHGGVMPVAAVGVRATPWDAKGRRNFRYINARNKPVEMQQAINQLGPYLTRFRGVDGFWVGQVATSQVPREVVTGLLAKVDQTNRNERLKVTRFLLQAEWYPETRAALDGLERDFPDSDMKEKVLDVRKAVLDLESRDILREAAMARKAQQPKRSLEKLRSLVNLDLAKDLIDEAREQLRKDEDQAVADRMQADTLRDLAEKLPEESRRFWKAAPPKPAADGLGFGPAVKPGQLGKVASPSRVAPLSEVLEAIQSAPDAARIRLDALTKADAAASAEVKFARAMSGWIVGADSASDDLKKAEGLWKAREIVINYLNTRDDAARSSLLLDLEKVEGFDIETLVKLVDRLPPPQRDGNEDAEKPGVARTLRVRDDVNRIPSEYVVMLPPEYHPLRSYPVIVALHHGEGPRSAVDWVAAEAARRGYIVVAPEYSVPGQPTGYHYTTGEHAAAILSLRDARKRFSIDSDRVFVAGQLGGGQMALDVGLAHPDQFAGAVSINGEPGKYVWAYKKQVDKVPLYVVYGELAPAVREVIYEPYLRTLIQDVKDVTYVDYLRRGLEELPEEVPSFFEWMDHRKRDPAPRSFEAATARDGDDRFFGVVVREFATGRVVSPEAVDPLGKNLRPATIQLRTSTQGNLLNLTTSGIAQMDVWVSPKLIDPKRKLEVRVNGTSIYKTLPKLDFAPLLDDQRNRADRQQPYFFKASTGGARRGR
jgi:acetyl esterase/lipase